jgi:hypothetical protein
MLKMLKMKIKWSTFMVFVIFAFTSELLMAQPGQSIMHGKGAPFQLSDLPQSSRLRKSLEALPAIEKGRAMNKLHGFSFPKNDVDVLEADSEGAIFYSESHLPQNVSVSPSVDTTTALTLPPIDVLKLHSRAGATRVLFLDFDGHVITGTAWNVNTPTYVALPFDIETIPNPAFNSDELNRIHEIWHRISEDYAPFDIDVTTEEPANFGPTVGRILFTKDIDANGTQMPSYGAGGVAYVNVYGVNNYATYYSPALVYYNRLGPNHPPYMAEAGSHEFGHNLSLTHDGTTNGAANLNCPGTLGYYCGQGSGLVSWGAIMGVGYYTNVTEWSKGEYTYANNTQDDLAIISGKLPYRVDDRGNSIATTTQLLVESDGSILNTTPQNDPNNTDPNNKGIIETSTDIDTFYLDVGAGSINITVSPSWAAFARSGTVNDLRGGNLDIKATLYDQSGSQIATNDPNNDTKATISTTVSMGRYFLRVSGVNNSVTPYSVYGSLGEYFISGSAVPVSNVPDTTAPTPNPMTWAAAPAVKSVSSITMTATTASDPSGGVQYQFVCVSGGTGCISSAWQSNPNYLATNLSADSSYSFHVLAKDSIGNITLASTDNSAKTAVAVTLPVSPSNLTATAQPSKKIYLQWIDNSSNELSFNVQRSTNGGGTWKLITKLSSNTTSYTNSNLTVGASYTYRIEASNSAGVSYSSTATAKAIR